MAVMKSEQIMSESTKSFEDAIQNVINEASKSVRNIKSVYVQDMQVSVKEGKISEYRVNAKVTFGIVGE